MALMNKVCNFGVCSREYIYWTEVSNGRIMRASLLPFLSETISILSVGLEVPGIYCYYNSLEGCPVNFITFETAKLGSIMLSDGLAVDWINNKIYFTDVDLNIVGVFDPVGFHYRVLVQLDSLAQPRAVVLDPSNRYVNSL